MAIVSYASPLQLERLSRPEKIEVDRCYRRLGKVMVTRSRKMERLVSVVQTKRTLARQASTAEPSSVVQDFEVHV